MLNISVPDQKILLVVTIGDRALAVGEGWVYDKSCKEYLAEASLLTHGTAVPIELPVRSEVRMAIAKRYGWTL